MAPAVGLCEDDGQRTPSTSWTGSRGRSCARSTEADEFPDEDDRRAIGERVVDTLVAIHEVDPDAVGLGELAKKEDYVARQLHRWQGQWEKQHTRELPLVDEVHDRLAARIPEQGPATIVHGDYRLDNMILAPSGEVAAVVDWELCTLGDPLADVGLLLVYWGEEGDDADPAAASRRRWRPGFPVARRSSARYAERSGRDLSRDRLLRRPRALEARDHPRGRLRPLRAPASTAKPEETREGDVVERLVVARLARRPTGSS